MTALNNRSNNTFEMTQELLRERADLSARLALIPYEGSVEVKEKGAKKYLYIRKRISGKLTSTYVGPYSEELHQLLLRDAATAKELRKTMRKIEKQLAQLGYTDEKLAPRVLLNLDFARANMSASIYDQAILEGVATSFPQTEEIINNGTVVGMSASDVQKVLNLKHAWEFVLDKDVLLSPSNLHVLCHIAKMVNEGFFENGGRLRGVPVTIGGTGYVPPLPQETVVAEHLETILNSRSPAIDKAIQLVLYCMKAQIFLDGNKRAAIIFANHFLVSRGGGLLVVPQELVAEFKELLVAYYEGREEKKMKSFMKKNCWRKYKASM